MGDVLIGILKDAIAAGFEMLLLPFMIEFLEAFQHWEQTKIHRPHIEGGDFGLALQGRLQPFLKGHARGAACGDIDDSRCRLLDPRQTLLEDLRILRRAPIGGFTHMKM